MEVAFPPSEAGVPAKTRQLRATKDQDARARITAVLLRFGQWELIQAGNSLRIGGKVLAGLQASLRVAPSASPVSIMVVDNEDVATVFEETALPATQFLAAIQGTRAAFQDNRFRLQVDSTSVGIHFQGSWHGLTVDPVVASA